ncbi:MAG: DUF4160 domain-containing protein [Clostridia bacterium]|nr:DUF4160 domain-containing protein [Clostridia bacterium]
MPQLLRIGPYTFYFWSNESDPLEPVHIHIVEGRPRVFLRPYPSISISRSSRNTSM